MIPESTVEKIGAFQIYLTKTISNSDPDRVEWWVTIHDPTSFPTETQDLGVFETKESALMAAHEHLRR
jgi:hypothetical protein